MTEFEAMTEPILKKMLKPLEDKVEMLLLELQTLERKVERLLSTPDTGSQAAWWQQQYVYPEALEKPPSSDAVIDGMPVLVTNGK